MYVIPALVVGRVEGIEEVAMMVRGVVHGIGLGTSNASAVAFLMKVATYP